jgi:hypothetical protein
MFCKRYDPAAVQASNATKPASSICYQLLEPLVVLVLIRAKKATDASTCFTLRILRITASRTIYGRYQYRSPEVKGELSATGASLQGILRMPKLTAPFVYSARVDRSLACPRLYLTRLCFVDATIATAPPTGSHIREATLLGVADRPRLESEYTFHKPLLECGPI